MLQVDIISESLLNISHMLRTNKKKKKNKQKKETEREKDSNIMRRFSTGRKNPKVAFLVNLSIFKHRIPENFLHQTVFYSKRVCLQVAPE